MGPKPSGSSVRGSWPLDTVHQRIPRDQSARLFRRAPRVLRPCMHGRRTGSDPMESLGAVLGPRSASGREDTTMTSNAWSHLPNAAHIDRVFADVTRNPKSWGAAWGAAWDAAWGAAWDAARYAARDAAWDAARYAARDAARDAARSAARGATAALVAYDDCAYLLDHPPNIVRAHIALTNDPAAILLLPASTALHGETDGQN